MRKLDLLKAAAALMLAVRRECNARKLRGRDGRRRVRLADDDAAAAAATVAVTRHSLPTFSYASSSSSAIIVLVFVVIVRVMPRVADAEGMLTSIASPNACHTQEQMSRREGGKNDGMLGEEMGSEPTRAMRIG